MPLSNIARNYRSLVRQQLAAERAFNEAKKTPDFAPDQLTLLHQQMTESWQATEAYKQSMRRGSEGRNR